MSYEFTAPIKDPVSELVHGFNWNDWLDQGETITGQPAVIARPAGLTISEVSQADGVVSYRVSGGSIGQSYIVSCQITTSLGRTEKRSARYPIGER